MSLSSTWLRALAALVTIVLTGGLLAAPVQAAESAGPTEVELPAAEDLLEIIDRPGTAQDEVRGKEFDSYRYIIFLPSRDWERVAPGETVSTGGQLSLPVQLDVRVEGYGFVSFPDWATLVYTDQPLPDPELPDTLSFELGDEGCGRYAHSEVPVLATYANPAEPNGSGPYRDDVRLLFEHRTADWEDHEMPIGRVEDGDSVSVQVPDPHSVYEGLQTGSWTVTAFSGNTELFSEKLEIPYCPGYEPEPEDPPKAKKPSGDLQKIKVTRSHVRLRVTLDTRDIKPKRAKFRLLKRWRGPGGKLRTKKVRGWKPKADVRKNIRMSIHVPPWQRRAGRLVLQFKHNGRWHRADWVGTGRPGS